MIHAPVIAGLSLSPIARPIASILAAIYSVVPNYGVAILALSLGWMILIAPLTLKTTRSMLAMQRLTPEINKLKAKHSDDRAALNQATMDLYKQEGVSPFGSCLPTLLPLPIFFALFRVIDGLSYVHGTTPEPRYLSSSTEMYRNIVASGGHLNAFGLDLSKNILSSHSSIASAAPYVIVLLVMMGTQYWQSASMMARNPASADNPQAKLMKYLPLVFGVFCLRFPAGVVIYYAMSNICRIAQQTIMYRFDPKVRALAAQDFRRIDKEAQEIEEGKIPRVGAFPTEPAPRSRFRDLLAAGQDQAQGRPSAGAKPGPAAKAKGTGAAKGAPGAKGPAGAKAGSGASPQVGGKPGAAKAGTAKTGPAKAAAAKVGTKAGAAKAGAGKVGPAKAGAAKVGVAGEGAAATAGGSPTGDARPASNGQAAASSGSPAPAPSTTGGRSFFGGRPKAGAASPAASPAPTPAMSAATTGAASAATPRRRTGATSGRTGAGSANRAGDTNRTNKKRRGR